MIRLAFLPRYLALHHRYPSLYLPHSEIASFERFRNIVSRRFTLVKMPTITDFFVRHADYY